MPPLDNPRWERFAQQLVKGKSQTEAYRNAGYRAKAATVNASQLLTKPKVAERLRELQEGAAARGGSRTHAPVPAAGVALSDD
jgi:phage terminase small subunit